MQRHVIDDVSDVVHVDGAIHQVLVSPRALRDRKLDSPKLKEFAVDHEEAIVELLDHRHEVAARKLVGAQRLVVALIETADGMVSTDAEDG